MVPRSTLPSPSLSLVSLVQSCKSISTLKQAHSRLLVLGLHIPLHSSLLSTLALSYLSLGLVETSLLIFPSINNPSSFLRNSIIRSCTDHERFTLSVELYKRFLPNFSPDKFTFPFVLKSCAALSDIKNGRILHQHAICFGCAKDRYVSAALVDFYSKCGEIEVARVVFDEMPDKDLVSWTSMISAYANNSCNIQTLEFFRLMQHEGIKPNRVSLLSVLLACGRLGVFKTGETFHAYSIEAGLFNHILVSTALIDMYAKCGNIKMARLVFDRIYNKDVVCWSAMIASYGYHGLAKHALRLFDEMLQSGIRPNHATFTSLLSSCSHARLVEQGKSLFNSMEKYGVKTELNHYSCMVDILARAGELNEAENLITKMPMKPELSIWGSLLNACRNYNNLDLGEKIADKIFELGSNNSGHYVLMSNIYAAKSRWRDVEKIRRIMRGSNVNKVQGFSLIEFKGEVHHFGVCERTHPQSKEIFAYLENIMAKIREMGYIPLVDFALHDIEEESKEEALAHHSERLAVVFGMINMVSEQTIRITKNLRICVDCHNVIKFMSKVENRMIIVRDINRFHHFENGVCSCGDYW